MQLFRCPECGREHDEPAEATFILAVVCLDCAFSAEMESARTAAFEATLVKAA